MENPVLAAPRSTQAPASIIAAPARPRVLAAIPCFNEELAIGGVVLRARRYADRVLVIDDGSRDKTVEVAELAGATVVQNPDNKGKGYSVRRAFRYAAEGGYDALVLLDGDGQHDPDEMPLLLQPVLRSAAEPVVDVTLGFRFGSSTEMPIWRRVGKRVLDYATAASAGGNVTDSQCGYRAFGRRAIEEMDARLRGEGFSIESEELVAIKDAGLRHENVRIGCKYDGIDGSTKGPVAHAWGVLENIVDMITSKRPLVFVGLPSVVVLVVAAGLLLETLDWYGRTHFLFISWALASVSLGLLGALGLMTSLVLNLVTQIERRVLARSEV